MRIEISELMAEDFNKLELKGNWHIKKRKGKIYLITDEPCELTVV